MKADAWMPLYVADYRKDTARLTCEQHGAYLLLIMDAWVGGPLPDDDVSLAQVAHLELKAWKKHRPTLERFFRVEGGEWVHKRVEQERGKAIRLRDARRETGLKGGRPRKQNESEQKPIGFDLLSKNPPFEKQNETPTRVAPPSPSPLPPEGSEDKSSGAVVALVDPNKGAWQMARSLLIERDEITPEAAGAFFGGLLKDHGLEARDMLGPLGEATANGTLNLRAYLTASAIAKAKRRAGPKLSPSELAARSNVQ